MNLIRNFRRKPYSGNNAWFILLIVSAFFTVLSNKFLTINNVRNILSQNAYVIIVMYGVFFYLLAGSVDLSVGYQISVIGIITGFLLTETSIPVWIVVLLTIGCGIFLSLINGFLSIYLKQPLMVVSLGTMTCYQGLSYVLSNSRTISGFPVSFKNIGQYNIAGVLPVTIIYIVVLYFLVWYILNNTYFGRFVYALGNNEKAFALSGNSVVKIKLLISGIAGFFIGLGSLVFTARLGSSNSTNGPGTELTVLTGILLGGVSLNGARGKISGALAGILVLSVISNGMQLAGFGSNAQYIVKGLILLVAVGYDAYRKDIKTKRTQKSANHYSL